VAAQYKQLSILLDGNPLESRNVYIPKSPEEFLYDVDGNLLQDGRWDYEWDGENRLKAMQTRYGLPATLPIRRLEFTYDYMSRRIQKRVLQPTETPPNEEEGKGVDGGSGGVTGDSEVDTPAGTVAPYGWTELGTTKYVWDGWNLMAELNGVYGPIRTYAWGLDLSGSEQGAGGIGGLVFETDWVFGGGNPGSTFHAFFDGNGNLTSLRDNGGVQIAAYEYGTFGEILTTGGFYAGINPFRFSTKFADAESGLLYYGYRYLNTSTGRWLSRDPIQEVGGINIYAMVGNGPSNGTDALGLWQQYGPWTKQRAWAVRSRCTGDTLERLAWNITGSIMDAHLARHVRNNIYDVQPLIDKLEEEIRSAIRRAAPTYRAAFSGNNDPRWVDYGEDAVNDHFRMGTSRSQDCRIAAMVIQAKGLIDHLSSVLPHPDHGRPNTFNGVFRRVLDIPRDSRTGITRLEDTKAGDMIEFENNSNYTHLPNAGDWQAENAIQLVDGGTGSIYAPGIGITSAADINQQLIREYNNLATASGQATISTVPGFNANRVIFFDMHRLASRIFHDRWHP
jgi:RHS repeat-associated protein